MADYQAIIKSSEGWLGKGGMPIDEEIKKANESPLDWLQNLDPVRFALDGNLPNIKNILEYHPTKTMETFIKSSSIGILESAHGANKSHNSLLHQDLAGKATALAANLKISSAGRATYTSSFQARDFFINLPNLNKDAAAYQGSIGDFWGKISRYESDNRTWLQRIVDAAFEGIELLEKKARAKARRLINILTGRLTRTRTVARLRIGATTNADLFIPRELSLVTNPTALDIAGIITQITSSILNTFLLRPLALPGAGISAIANTTSSIVLKNLALPGAEMARYLAGSALKQLTFVLPNMWTATGVFTGAWGFLMAASPYIIAGAVLVTAAIKMSKEVDVGNWINILAFKDSGKPDIGVALAEGSRGELIKDFIGLRNKLVNETGKEYSSIYGFSFKSDRLKLSLDMSGDVPLTLKQEQALAMWTDFSSRYPYLVDDTLPFF